MGLELKYFVLNPNSSDTHHAVASIEAILSYASKIREANPCLAYDLEVWISKIELGEE